MVLPKKKKEKIRKLLKERKTWEYIRNKEGVSNDAINNIRQESLSPPAPTAPQTDKTQKVIQDLTNQKQQPPKTEKTPDPHVLHLEQKINDVDQGLRTNNQRLQNVVEILNQLKQSQQPQETKDPHQEKPDNQPDLNELTHQETKSLPSTTPEVKKPKKNPFPLDPPNPETHINTLPSLDFDTQQTPTTNLTQTVTPPENQEDEDQTISSYRNAYIFREATKAIPSIIKFFKDHSNYTKTGFFPHADYIKKQNNTKNETKIKKPILSDKSKPSPPSFQLDPMKEKMYREHLEYSNKKIEKRMKEINERLKKPSN